MHVLWRGGGLHLNQPPTAFRQPLQHIGPHQHMLMLKRGLEERWPRPEVKETPRLRQRLRHMLMIMGDQMPTGIPPTSQLAHFMAGVEDQLQGLADGRGQIAGMEVVPEAEVALVAGEVGGLGEAGVERSSRSCVRRRSATWRARRTHGLVNFRLRPLLSSFLSSSHRVILRSLSQRGSSNQCLGFPPALIQQGHFSALILFLSLGSVGDIRTKWALRPRCRSVS